MPIAKLFIEGNLESEVLTPILEGTPLLVLGGSKNALKPRARVERHTNNVNAGYLRDRDFDFDPPQDLSRPTVDSDDKGATLGWRWCRHEIENYLIDPAVVSDAMAWPILEIEEALLEAAKRIRSYEAARWTVGVVRRALPPHYALRTRPDGLNDIALPAALDSGSVSAWAFEIIENYRTRLATTTHATSVHESLDAFAVRFDDAFVADVANVLVWFSGKDILAGMADWLTTKSIAHPGAFRALLRDWIIANPARTLELLPEWNAMIELLRT